MDEVKLVTCLVCGKEMRKIINPTHLRTHGMTADDYRKLDPTAKFSMVKAWNKGLTKETSESMRKSSESHKTPEYLQRYQTTMIERHGVTAPAKDPDTCRTIVRKREETMRRLYGVPNFSHTESAKETLSAAGRKGMKSIHSRYDQTGYRTIWEQKFHGMFPHLLCNQKILTGVRPGIAGMAAWYSPDFIDESTKTIYEIDGGFHDKEHDDKKDDFYRSLGCKVIRLTNEQVDLIYDEWIKGGGACDGYGAEKISNFN